MKAIKLGFDPDDNKSATPFYTGYIVIALCQRLNN